jgi:hypothetical protein
MHEKSFLKKRREETLKIVQKYYELFLRDRVLYFSRRDLGTSFREDLQS